MLIAYPEANVRRSVYAILLFLAVLGPAIMFVLVVKDAVAPSLLIGSFFAGMIGVILLCIWCAVYVREEPERVRLALMWIAVLFSLFVLSVSFTRLS